MILREYYIRRLRPVCCFLCQLLCFLVKLYIFGFIGFRVALVRFCVNIAASGNGTPRDASGVSSLKSITDMINDFK